MMIYRSDMIYHNTGVNKCKYKNEQNFILPTKIPAHEQYAGFFAVYYILGELCASY